MFESIRSRPRLHVLVVGLGLTIVVGSLLPVPEGTATSWVPAGADKVAHFGGYALFAGVLAAARDARTRRTLGGVVLATVALGIAMEFVQANLPSRLFSTGDALANAAGAFVGALAWVRYRKRFER